MTDRQRTGTGGFTLVELLVVMGVIGLLAAIIIPSVNTGFKAAKNAKAMGQVKDLQEACHRYYAEYNRAPVPAGTIWSYRFEADGKSHRFHLTGLELGAELAHYLHPAIQHLGARRVEVELFAPQHTGLEDKVALKLL